jgi:hypothetical protein
MVKIEIIIDDFLWKIIYDLMYMYRTGGWHFKFYSI